MKYGLIVNFKTQNLGDDVQSYATEKFLPRLDYLIDREHLDSFYTKTGEKVAAFLSGWYLHKVLNWPPSPFLKLLPISFHITPIEAKKKLTLMDYGSRWLKQFPTIGCRDRGTVKELNKLQINAYLSGCFTLTLEPFEDVIAHEKIVLTDLSKEVVTFIKRRTLKEVVEVSHDNKVAKMPPEAVEYAKTHAKTDAIVTSHLPTVPDKAYRGSHYQGNWNFRRALAEGLLKFYQGASLVVTSRLHTALPCLALGTPILFIKDAADLQDYRISSYLPYFNYTTPEDLLMKNYVYDFDEPIANPGGNEKLAEIIKRASAEFIASCESAPEEPKVDLETWMDTYRRNLRLKRILKMFAPGAEQLDWALNNPKLYKF